MKIEYSNTEETVAKMASRREPTSVRLPDGVGFFQFKNTGLHQVDILPYLTTKDPSRKNPHCNLGAAHYERTWHAHRNMGIDGRSSYVCLEKTFNERCPVCQAARAEEDEALRKAMLPQQRMLFAVIDRNDPARGVQVWDSPYWKSFGQMLTNKLAFKKYHNFFHLKGGRTLSMQVVDQAIGTGKPFKNVTVIEFEDRNDYEDSILDKVPCLDELLIKLSYEQLDRIHNQEPEPDEVPTAATGIRFGPVLPEPKAEAPKPAKKVEAVTREPDLSPGDFVHHEKVGRCSVVKVVDLDEGVGVWLRDEKGIVHKQIAKEPILASSCKVLED